ncbi:hypothetical protein M378DRAFT_165903 [Amanita muscaria Koide BX008]|uniref:Uncharacterized protein n=1 Tax=Amanita muscaria (strain Koide BX008) TaxID=946122 RepID=A0A0C2X0Y2_AMAMK|nr:hypothetical protein M378DRAFT_165903 [Amanita muscaria Koide BX008]
MSSASEFPGTGRTIGGTLSSTTTMTKPAPSISSASVPGQGAAEMSNGSANKAPAVPKMIFSLSISEQSGNVNVGNGQKNGGGVYRIVRKESPEKNESRTQKGAREADTPDKTEKQERKTASEDQPTIKLGKLQGNFNYGDDQVNEGGKYEL